ncbi:hypothetical protein ACLKA6_008186 [Drosophila palustris]
MRFLVQLFGQRFLMAFLIPTTYFLPPTTYCFISKPFSFTPGQCQGFTQEMEMFYACATSHNLIYENVNVDVEGQLHNWTRLDMT